MSFFSCFGNFNRQEFMLVVATSELKASMEGIPRFAGVANGPRILGGEGVAQRIGVELQHGFAGNFLPEFLGPFHFGAN